MNILVKKGVPDKVSDFIIAILFVIVQYQIFNFLTPFEIIISIIVTIIFINILKKKFRKNQRFLNNLKDASIIITIYIISILIIASFSTFGRLTISKGPIYIAKYDSIKRNFATQIKSYNGKTLANIFIFSNKKHFLIGLSKFVFRKKIMKIETKNYFSKKYLLLPLRYKHEQIEYEVFKHINKRTSYLPINSAIGYLLNIEYDKSEESQDYSLSIFGSNSFFLSHTTGMGVNLVPWQAIQCSQEDINIIKYAALLDLGIELAAKGQNQDSIYIIEKASELAPTQMELLRSLLLLCKLYETRLWGNIGCSQALAVYLRVSDIIDNRFDYESSSKHFFCYKWIEHTYETVYLSYYDLLGEEAQKRIRITPKFSIKLGDEADEKQIKEDAKALLEKLIESETDDKENYFEKEIKSGKEMNLEEFKKKIYSLLNNEKHKSALFYIQTRLNKVFRELLAKLTFLYGNMNSPDKIIPYYSSTAQDLIFLKDLVEHFKKRFYPISMINKCYTIENLITAVDLFRRRRIGLKTLIDRSLWGLEQFLPEELTTSKNLIYKIRQSDNLDNFAIKNLDLIKESVNEINEKLLRKYNTKIDLKYLISIIEEEKEIEIGSLIRIDEEIPNVEWWRDEFLFWYFIKILSAYTDQGNNIERYKIFKDHGGKGGYFYPGIITYLALAEGEDFIKYVNSDEINSIKKIIEDTFGVPYTNFLNFSVFRY